MQTLTDRNLHHMLTKKDLDQIKQRGITKETIERQLDDFKHGFPFAKLHEPATKGNGILAFTEKEIHELITNFERSAKDLKLVKFVPASGAATRMFKHLFEFREVADNKKEAEKLLVDKGFNSVGYFFENLRKFAFYDDLKRSLSRAGLSIDELLKKGDLGTILDHLMTEKGLNYGNLPKGLIKFHHYGNFARTATGEHLVEGAHYCANRSKKVTVHLTVSPEHLSNFFDLIAYVQP